MKPECSGPQLQLALKVCVGRYIADGHMHALDSLNRRLQCYGGSHQHFTKFLRVSQLLAHSSGTRGLFSVDAVTAQYVLFTTTLLFNCFQSRTTRGKFIH